MLETMLTLDIGCQWTPKAVSRCLRKKITTRLAYHKLDDFLDLIWPRDMVFCMAPTRQHAENNLILEREVERP